LQKTATTKNLNFRSPSLRAEHHRLSGTERKRKLAHLHFRGSHRGDAVEGDVGEFETVLAAGGSMRDAQFLADHAERLRGSIEILWRAYDDFYVPIESVGETGDTAIDGQFAAYRALWKPLVGPALLLGFSQPHQQNTLKCQTFETLELTGVAATDFGWKRVQ